VSRTFPSTTRSLSADVSAHSFYQFRNSWVGLLDPLLHTPQFVRSNSFTLFSVICALGCAMSDRARDKLLCPALVSLAEGNIKWSIAASVRKVETIQAIINMTYWAPLSERQCDDPYWLRLTHVRSRWKTTTSIRLRRLADVANHYHTGSADCSRNGHQPIRSDLAESRCHPGTL
jgi:hypothetical protein